MSDSFPYLAQRTQEPNRMTNPFAIVAALPLVSTAVDDATLGKQYRAVFAVHGREIERVVVGGVRDGLELLTQLAPAPAPAPEAPPADPLQAAAERVRNADAELVSAINAATGLGLLLRWGPEGNVHRPGDVCCSTSLQVVVPERVLVG